jgi:uncharacterized paraquat-inducible protein A
MNHVFCLQTKILGKARQIELPERKPYTRGDTMGEAELTQECPNCGILNPDEPLVCMRCGHRIGVTWPREETEPEDQ